MTGMHSRTTSVENVTLSQMRVPGRMCYRLICTEQLDAIGRVLSGLLFSRHCVMRYRHYEKSLLI